jgi:hypothetical protein
LVRIGERALAAALNDENTKAEQLRAMSEYRAIVKQLALVARSSDAAGRVPDAEPTRVPLRVVRRSVVDPRRALMAVSE